MKLTSALIKCFFKELSKFPIKSYYSKPNTIQSSVGIIFKFPNFESIETKQHFDKQIKSQEASLEDTELLFVQRAGYHSDRNAYNVVFPGGQCDGQEADITACERQLKQQIGIEANKQCIYLGQLPKNFYYLKKRGKQVDISCHAYLLKSSESKWEPKLNSDQLRKFKWVKFSDLLKAQNYKKRNQIKLGMFQRMPAFAAKIAKQNISNVTMLELDLGMDRNLWGITLFIWSYMLQMAIHNMKEKLSKQQLSNLGNLVNLMNCFQLQFKPYSLYKYPATIIASGWHYLYRVRPFTYIPENEKFPYFPKTVIFLVFLVILINYYFALF